MNTTALPPGIYRIEVAGGVEPECLTRESGDRVTILPLSTQLDAEQRWQISRGEDGNIIIERPTGIFPGTYLTYKDFTRKPKEGDPIKCHIFPLNPTEWHLVIAPGFRSFIRVADSDLGIKISPITINPPSLELGHDDQLQWVFVRVDKE